VLVSRRLLLSAVSTAAYMHDHGWCGVRSTVLGGNAWSLVSPWGPHKDRSMGAGVGGCVSEMWHTHYGTGCATLFDLVPPEISSGNG
jgi:hypothetical protein